MRTRKRTGKFPSRPIELIVPTPPGGGVDIVARMLAELVEPALGNEGGRRQQARCQRRDRRDAVGASEPDGYTLAAVWNAPLTVTPHTLAVSYGLDDYTPVTQLTGGTPFGVLRQARFPAANGKEFVELLRKSPDKYNYGNDGVAGGVQLAAERAFGRLGIKARPVPFGGAGESRSRIFSAGTWIYGRTIPTSLEHVRAGQAKCQQYGAVAVYVLLP